METMDLFAIILISAVIIFENKVRGQISEHIFGPNRGYCLYIRILIRIFIGLELACNGCWAPSWSASSFPLTSGQQTSDPGKIQKYWTSFGIRHA